MDNIIFFDGECMLCNGFVDFLIKKDKKNIFKFASLQGETAKKIIPEKYKYIDSVIYFQKGNCYIKYDAVSKIASQLPFPYSIGIICKFIPNQFYDYIAKKRYQWFGKKETCRMPQKEDTGKILP